MTATEVKEECSHCGEQLYRGHPESLLNIKVTATLLFSPFTRIVFRYSQIDWASHDCESNGILVSNYFSPVHLQPFMVERFGYKKGDFPVVESVSESTIALPFYNNLLRYRFSLQTHNEYLLTRLTIYQQYQTVLSH